VGLYVHFPWCVRKCPYCDFNSHPLKEPLRETEYREALLDDFNRELERFGDRRITTVYFGGGTPSLLEGASIGRILDAIRDGYALDADAEITLEANPESVRADRLAAYRAAGVNRLSMGVQSLDPGELAFLDRLHDAERARWAFETARAAGFDNINCDLIFGLPGQSPESWRRSLEGVASWGPDHLSCYGLTVEDGTPLAQRVAEGRVTEADPDVVAEMSEWTEERLAAMGYRQYEISNWARADASGRDRACRHNLVYWRQGDYVGAGPGAHGFVDGVRYAVERSPARYVAALAAAGEEPRWAAVVSQEAVEPATAAVDAAVLGLRLNAGIDEAALRSRYGPAWAVVEPGLRWGEESGLLERSDGRLRLTRRGRRLANEVFVRIVAPEVV
jgi:oxygen-independent coproporphyrinogen-3 oxidase